MGSTHLSVFSARYSDCALTRYLGGEQRKRGVDRRELVHDRQAPGGQVVLDLIDDRGQADNHLPIGDRDRAFLPLQSQDELLMRSLVALDPEALDLGAADDLGDAGVDEAADAAGDGSRQVGQQRAEPGQALAVQLRDGLPGQAPHVDLVGDGLADPVSQRDVVTLGG